MPHAVLLRWRGYARFSGGGPRWPGWPRSLHPHPRASRASHFAGLFVSSRTRRRADPPICARHVVRRRASTGRPWSSFASIVSLP